MDQEQQQRVISIWSKAVETQMHFNEMSVKSRQLGLTFVAAALGVAVVLLSRGDDFSLVLDLQLFKFTIHVSVILLLAAIVALGAVKQLDLGVYHKMLRGAVTFGEDFEEHYMKKIFDLEKGMTQAISHFSRYDDAKKHIGENGKYCYSGSRNISAEDKIRRFYYQTTSFLVIGAVALFFATNITLWTGIYFGPPRTADEQLTGGPVPVPAPPAPQDDSLPSRPSETAQ